MIKDNTKRFLKLCAKVQPGLIGQFEELFFTFQEKKIFASRFLIIKELLEGKLSQREISKKLKTSISQITRGSNALKVADKELIALLKSEMYD